MGAPNEGQHARRWQLYAPVEQIQHTTLHFSDAASDVARVVCVHPYGRPCCAGKNHICLDAHYVECNFDNSTIITGNWIDGGKQLNVTGADPDVCPKAPALPIPEPWYLWQNGRCD